MKKRIVLGFAIIFIAFLTIVLFVLNDPNVSKPDSIVGVWDIESGDYVYSVEFRKNGTYEYIRPSGEQLDRGVYSIKSINENSTDITLISGSTGKLIQFKVFDNVMVNLTYTMKLERMNFDNGLYGAWKALERGDIWVIEENGIISSARDTYAYKKNGDVYQGEFLESGNTCPILFEYDGTNVVLYVGLVFEKRA